MKKLIIATALTGAIFTSGAAAQEMRAALTLESASTIRDTCLAYAEENDMVIAIAVFDQGGNLVTLAAMDGIAPAITEVAQWKGKSAATYRFSSEVTGSWGPSTAPGIAGWKGGLPLFTRDGAPLGGVGASGADSDDDVACIEAGIAAAGLSSSGTSNE